eukprot:scaffold292104_cov31-Attheya_sp.AAC.2
MVDDEFHSAKTKHDDHPIYNYELHTTITPGVETRGPVSRFTPIPAQGSEGLKSSHGSIE